MASSPNDKVIDLLTLDDDDKDMGSFVIPADQRGFLRAVAAMAPNVNTIDFFVKLSLALGNRRAKKVVNYLMDHAEVQDARGNAVWRDGHEVRPDCKLRLVDDCGEELTF